MATYIYGPVRCSGVAPNGSGGTIHPYLGRVVVEETVNAAANTSDISWSFQLYLDPTWTSAYSYSNNNRVYVSVDNQVVVQTGNIGTVQLGGHYETGSPGPLVIASGTRTINHNSDGSKSLRIEAEYTQASSSYMGTIRIDAERNLTQIPRSSGIDSITNVNVGEYPTIKWTPTVSSYSYRITLSLGTWTAQIPSSSEYISPGTTSQYTYSSYQIPTSVANQITTSPSGVATCTIETFNGSTSLGSSSTTFTITVPNNSTYKPTALLSVTPVNTKGNPAMNLANITSYNYSATSSSAKNGASIASYAVAVTNPAGNVIHAGQDPTGTLPPVSAAGNYTFSLIVTDSRGYTGVMSSPTTVAVTQYAKPSVMYASVMRGTGDSVSDFVEDESGGTKAKVTYLTTYTQIGNNSPTVTIQCINNDTSAVIATVNNAPVGSGTGGAEVIVPSSGHLSFETSYTFVISITDTFNDGTPGTMSVVLPIGWFPMDFMETGDGVGIGRVATASGAAQFGWNVELRDNKTIKFFDNSGTKRSELYSGTHTVYREVITYNSTYFNTSTGECNLSSFFNFDVLAVVSIVGRAYSYPVYWYIYDATPGQYKIYLKRVDGETITTGTSFEVIAIRAA